MMGRLLSPGARAWLALAMHVPVADTPKAADEVPPDIVRSALDQLAGECRPFAAAAEQPGASDGPPEAEAVFVCNALSAYAADFCARMWRHHGRRIVLGDPAATEFTDSAGLTALGVVGCYEVFNAPAKSAGGG